VLDANREFIALDLRQHLRVQRTPSAAYRLFVHLVFSTRFRFRALTAGAERRFLELLREVAGEQGFVVLALSVNEEHVHLVLSLQPRHAVADVVKAIKGRTSRVLRQEFPELAREATLWTSGYYVDSLGEKNVPQIIAYVQMQRDRLETGRAD
jgi:putative transposase